ncbi:Ribonuclease P protein subunit p30 [Bulinus truncatus]|nr:Ribonuclease P protein subunit p30 [Bulinus truncatus]
MSLDPRILKRLKNMALSAYCDFNLKWQTKEKLIGLVEVSVELGYESVVVNNHIQSLQGSKGKKQIEKSFITPPSEILLEEKTINSLQCHGKPIEQLSRLTAVLQDASNTHRLGNPDILVYDILAVQPTDEKTFQLACKTLEVDVICLNFTENLGFSLKRQLLNLAASRGIHFEIIYSPALASSQVKRNVISNALSLVKAICGKNIIISSGAEQPIDLRSPYDVINLARLFGLNHSQAKDALCKNCRAVLMHAKSRKTCKSVILVKSISMLESKKKWILNTKSQNENVSDNDDEDDSSESVDDDEPEIKKIKMSPLSRK